MRQPGLRYDAEAGGYPVWLFSDLKRHDMGPANAAKHVQRGVGLEEYLTPQLWGVAARTAFEALDLEEKGALRVYLMSLRRAPRVFVP